jgi:hypothetical protein
MQKPKERYGNKEKVLCANFNQDLRYGAFWLLISSCVSVGTDQGFKIFTVDPFKQCFSHRMITNSI